MEFFCNWTGGSGNNIETDLAQEICNNISKSAVKRLGGNKILTTVNRICRAVSGIKLLTDNYFQNLCIHKVSSKHATQSAKKDEECMVSELVKLEAFNYIPDRKHNTFPDIKRSPLLYLDFREMRKWIEKHKSQMSGL